MGYLDSLKIDDQWFKKIGFNPYYNIIEGALNDPLIIEGEEFINLASNNYLGIANDIRIKKAMIEGLEKYGVSMCATPIASGYTDLYDTVRKKLAVFTGVDDCIIFPSCYQANNGLFKAIVTNSDIVIVDQYSHSSLIEGIKSTRCKIRPFLHNNIESLEKNLSYSKEDKNIFVITESVFSTDGTIAPMAEIYNLCKKYNAIPVVDDSHGIGVLGKNGKGILSHAEIIDYNGIYTASLGKAFANTGGIIGGKKELINYLKYYCSHLVYSTVLPPVIIAGINKTIDIIETEFVDLSDKLLENTMILRNGIKDHFHLSQSLAPIVSIICGTSEQTILLAKYLFENRILTTPFIYPSVPKNGGIVRLIAGANLKNETIRKAVDIFKKYKTYNY
jgi:7-keto-8-aminopelargonate synthetase-like enzyme